MDAIFQYPMDYMDEPLKRYDSYMERASLQLKVELEEYVESTLTTSGSTFIIESSETFFEKFKRGIKLIIEKLKEFINDTKMNFQKYIKEKNTESRINKLSSIINKSNKLSSEKVEYKDYSKKSNFISKKKEELKKLFRKKDVSKEGIKKFIDDYKHELSTMDKVKVVVTTVSIATVASMAFYRGFCDGLKDATERASSDVKDLESTTISNIVKESVSNDKDDVAEDADIIALYTKALADMCTDEIVTQRQMLMAYEEALSDVEKIVDKFLDEMGDE